MPIHFSVLSAFHEMITGGYESCGMQESNFLNYESIGSFGHGKKECSHFTPLYHQKLGRGYKEINKERRKKKKKKNKEKNK